MSPLALITGLIIITAIVLVGSVLLPALLERRHEAAARNAMTTKVQRLLRDRWGDQ